MFGRKKKTLLSAKVKGKGYYNLGPNTALIHHSILCKKKKMTLSEGKADCYLSVQWIESEQEQGHVEPKRRKITNKHGLVSKADKDTKCTGGPDHHTT